MGTINEKINYLNQTKDLIKQAIINKGVEVSESDTFRSYADKISNIKNGGTGEDIDFEEITITPTTETQVKEGAFSKVTVEAVETEELNVTSSLENQEYNGLFGKVNIAGLYAEEITITPSTETQVKEGVFSKVTVEPIAESDDGTSAKITDGAYLFNNGARLDYLQQILNLCEKITSAYYMFNGCYSLTELDVSNLDTSEVTTMGCMFYNCSRLTELDVSNFDTSKVTTLYNMFYQCSNLTELDLSNFNTSEVTSMSGMFYQCSNLTKLDVSNFNTSKVTTMNKLFGNCTKLTELDLSNWDASKVNNTYQMFGSNYAMTVLKFMKNLGKGYKQKTNNYSDHRVDLQNCSKLTRENLVSIMNDLYDLNLTYDVANGGTLYTQSLTIGTTNRNKLTPEDIAIATNKRMDGKLERRNKMIFFNYTTPRMIVAERGKHIRAINDVYIPAHYDEEGNFVEEHLPHYSTTIFVPDIYQTMEDVEKDYVEEDII